MKVHKRIFSEREFHKEHIGNVRFYPNLQFWENHKKHFFFATFCLKWDKNLQNF